MRRMVYVNNRFFFNRTVEPDIGSKSGGEVIQSKTKNIASEFRASGLCTSSFPVIQRRLKLFKDSGIALSETNPTWMRCRETV